MTKRNSLSLAELSRYAEDSGINDRVFDRVYLLRRYQETESFDYRDFVWFILSEEDKVREHITFLQPKEKDKPKFKVVYKLYKFVYLN